MSDSWSSKVNELKARLREVASNSEGEVDTEAVIARVREAVGKAGSDVDTEALMARVKDFAGKAEGKVDAEKLKQWVEDVDTEKMKGWLGEARTLTAGAAAVVGTQSERLAERAPGVIDKLLGAAKEMFGDATGNEDVAREGELERFRGEIKDRFASASEAVEGEAKDVADATKSTYQDDTERGGGGFAH